LLLDIVEVVLIPGEDHLVTQQRPADLGDRSGVKVTAESDTIDARRRYGCPAASQSQRLSMGSPLQWSSQRVRSHLTTPTGARC
jgi:hypothetical protein